MLTDDGGVHTLFAVQVSFFPVSTVRFCRRHIRRIPEIEGNVQVWHRSWLVPLAAARWFRIIGFVDKGSRSTPTLLALSPA